jgi:hypothetical protein
LCWASANIGQSVENHFFAFIYIYHIYNTITLYIIYNTIYTDSIILYIYRFSMTPIQWRKFPSNPRPFGVSRTTRGKSIGSSWYRMVHPQWNVCWFINHMNSIV